MLELRRVVAVMGPSGSGKSMPLTIAGTLQEPDFNLLPGLTAAENVSLPLELDGLSARKARVAGLRTLERLGLGKRSARYPDQLSGGERQRVAIARAMVGERRLLNGACKDAGMTAVVVTHDAQLASWADQVAHPRDGRVSDQGGTR